ncbi:hypothetical protein MHYP_G00345670 [Metynnis hypsauchen]
MMLSSSVEVPSPGGMSVAAARNVVRSSSISGAMYSLEKSPSSSGPDATGMTGNKKRRSSLGAKMVAIVGLSQWSKSTLQLNQQGFERLLDHKKVLFPPCRVETPRGGSGGPIGERGESGRVAALCDSPIWAIDTSLQLLSALILLHCLTPLCHLHTATDPGLQLSVEFASVAKKFARSCPHLDAVWESESISDFPTLTRLTEHSSTPVHLGAGKAALRESRARISVEEGVLDLENEPHAGAYGRVAVPCYNIAPPSSSSSLCQPGTYATRSVSMETAGLRHVLPLPLGSDEHGCQKELSVFFIAGLPSNLMEKAC